MLKRVTADYNRLAMIGLYLLGDYLQDGAIDGSLMMTALGVG